MVIAIIGFIKHFQDLRNADLLLCITLSVFFREHRGRVCEVSGELNDANQYSGEPWGRKRRVRHWIAPSAALEVLLY